MRALRTIVLSAALAFGGSALAATPSIVVPVDQSTRLEVAGSAASVLVGSPAVADVTVVDSHTLYVTGRNYGSTDVVVLDQFGSTLFRGSVVVTAPDVGRVTVYRGGARTDFACAPSCQVASRAAGAPAPASAPSAPPAP
jgi:Flp pilus assembly secretin CpaC